MSESNVDHVVVYRDVSASRFRWRAVAGNGEIVSEGEAHTREADAARAARGVFGREVPIFREYTTPDGNGVTIAPWEGDDGPA